MKEIRISFTKENRDKSRSGLKTQTRRLMNPQPDNKGAVIFTPARETWYVFPTESGIEHWTKCPYGAPGDRLYLLESYQITGVGASKITGIYLDDNAHFCVEPTDAEWTRLHTRKDMFAPTQARFMYKSLARTWFDVTEVRAERIQEISEEDAMAEGCLGMETYLGNGNIDTMAPVDMFRELWDSINGKRSPWSQNDWVWAVTYKAAAHA